MSASVRHFAQWPMMWSPRCGAAGSVTLFGELDLVTCRDCRSAVIQAEILGAAS